jgi:methionyl-tRNA formyltransferase
VVVLTTRSFRGTTIIKALQDAGIHIHAVVLDRGDLTSRDSMRKFRRYLRRRGLGQTLRGLARRIRRTVTQRRRKRRKESFVRAFPGDVFEVADPNSDSGVQLLTDLAPDVIVLGTTRILKPNVLSIPSMGVLNPHPGLLPDYRGLDVLHWAVYNGHPLGVTVHFLDPGIDTGPSVVGGRADGRHRRTADRHRTPGGSRTTPRPRKDVRADAAGASTSGGSTVRGAGVRRDGGLASTAP